MSTDRIPAPLTEPGAVRVRRGRGAVMTELLRREPHVISAGLGLLADAAEWQAARVTRVDWTPPMAGTEEDLVTVLADPRSLDYRNGQLRAGDFQINLIYKRVLCSELIQRMGMDNPIVRAVKDGAVDAAVGVGRHHSQALLVAVHAV